MTVRNLLLSILSPFLILGVWFVALFVLHLHPLIGLALAVIAAGAYTTWLVRGGRA